MNADSPAGREPADTSRTERVAHIGAIIGALYSLAGALDKGEPDEAEEIFDRIETLCVQLAEAVQREVEALRERQRGSEALHGEAPQDAEMSDG